MRKLVIALLGNFEGVNPSEYYPCDTQPRDINRAASNTTLSLDYQENLNPEDTEYGEEWHRFNLQTDETVDETVEYDSLCTINANGILTWNEAFNFLSEIDAEYEDCDTMETLGGPANPLGWAPDFSFHMKSSLILDSIRITPMIWNTTTEELSLPTESTWSRIRQLFQRTNDTFRLCSMGSVDLPENALKEEGTTP